MSNVNSILCFCTEVIVMFLFFLFIFFILFYRTTLYSEMLLIFWLPHIFYQGGQRVFMYMACLKYPKFRMFRAAKMKMRVPVINNSMRRDRFFKIRRSINVLMSLMRRELMRGQPRLVMMNSWLPAQAGVLYSSLCQGKPDRTAHKVFVLASPSGLVLDFESTARIRSLIRSWECSRWDGTVSSKRNTSVL